ncbi:MAG: hypothetical protein U1E25_15555 [Methylocystis sp.]
MEHRARPKGADYARRINRVLDYIDKHLDEDLTVDAPSEVANFSKFHFIGNSPSTAGSLPRATFNSCG